MKNNKKLWWLALPIGIIALWFGFYTYLNINEPTLYDSVDDSTAELSELVDSSVTGNPIDRAFVRIADERGNELEDNMIFKYLYALKWYEEYQALLGLETYTFENWKLNRYSDKMKDTALIYAENWGATNKAECIFAEVALFYQALTDELLAHSDKEIAMKTNEEELYQFLNEVNYDNGVYMFEYSYDERYPMLVYADLIEEGIYISYARPFGVVLSVNGENYFFQWSNGTLTSKWILPQLYLNDYNSDGIDELVVILYVDSGTGVAVTELHIIDIYGSMGDIAITYESIEKLLFHRLSACYDPLAEMVTVKLDNQTIDIDASQVDKERKVDFQKLDLSSIIYFSEENGSLNVHIAIGLCGFDPPIPFDYVDFYAEIIILDEMGNISLANCYIEKNVSE